MKPGPGRPSKGPRDAFFTRTAVPLGAQIRRNAADLEMPYGDYIAMLLAQALNMPEHAPKPPGPSSQQELPLKTA